MTQEKSKLKKEEADKPELKTLKKIKKHKSDKPSKAHDKPSCKNPDFNSIQIIGKKHKSDEPKSLNPEILETKKKKKKKHESEEPHKQLSSSPERIDSKTPDFDLVRTPEKKKKKKKKHESDKPQNTHSSSPEKADSIQTLEKKKKKKKKHKSDQPKPHSPKPGNFDCQIDADSVPILKKKKRKLDKPHSLNPDILEIDTDSIHCQKKKKKQKLDKLQPQKPEKLDSQIEDVSIQTPKKKKEQIVDELQKPPSVDPEILDSEIDIDSVQSLLEPHSKDQLIEFLLDSAVKTPSISSKIIKTANEDISHRRIFVHNLNHDTTKESVVSVFQQYGALEACKIVYDRVTRKTKGFGFVVFKSRECAKKALKEPKKRIGNRIVSCQLASVGPPVMGCVDNSSRKIYVGNVERDVDSWKLREFFEKFGEIEAGPLGFDMQTGKSKGYAFFVYKNLEGVRKVLEEPNKIFDGKQLICQMAIDCNGRKKNNKSDSSVTTIMMPVPHDLSAVLPKQNMAMVGQPAGLNPMLGQLGFNSIAGGLYANPSASLLDQLLSQAGIGVNYFGQMGAGFGGYGEAMIGEGMGGLGWNQSALGPFSGSPSAPVFQGWPHAYLDT